MNKLLPILMVAKDDYLNKLQMGEVYLKNCIYYQKLEDDEQRSDKYDSAIPSNISFPGTTNGRFTIPSAYIKSFFQYKPENIKGLSETKLALYIPSSSIIALKDLSKNTEGNGLLIWDTKEFIKRFVKKSDELKIKCDFGTVKYIDDCQFVNYESIDIFGIRTSIPNFIFIKRKRFEPQQEFRIVVSCPEKMSEYEPSHLFSGDESNRFINDAKNVPIEPIFDISTIVNLQEIINEPYVLICSEGN